VFSKFFIDRPIFAAVMSIVITLAGIVAIPTLPVAQYPQITPPSIIVSCTYPGASAQVVAESVAAPIEQQVNGVEDMLYMSSQSANDGSYSLSVTFKPGVNMNFAQVLVQNRVNLALPLLPDVVKQTGVTTRKRNPDILQIISLYSPHDRYDQLYLSNYATVQVRDELLRVDGVGDVFNFGQQDYSMRVWVDPDRLASMDLTAGDVLGAIREQNRQIVAGHVGQPSVVTGSADAATAAVPFEFPLATLGRLSEPEQFGDIVVRSVDGRQVRVRDVGRVEVGARNQDTSSKIDGHPATSLALFQLPYANAIATADRVRKKMEELKKKFPADVEYVIGYDTSPFMEESIWGVLHTLVEAIILVAVVVLVFLQSWRSTLIPLVAVPVAVIGTFAVMAAIGFSLNNLTLFGLVLAIGIVVDDAIVVVEAVEHHIEEGMKPRQAAYRAMEEVSGPVVAVALVLSAVFIPCAFISGITGLFFRQFALTIAVSTIISAFNSLTLSPALAALLLKPRGARKDFVGRLIHLLLGWFFRLFNWCFRRTTSLYTRLVGLALRGSAVVLVVYGGLVVLTWCGFTSLPTGYIPLQDQGKMYVAVQLPDASSHERTSQIMDRIAGIVMATPGVAHTTAVVGQSHTIQANGSNFGNCFVTLDEFDKRRTPDMRDVAIIARLQKKLNAEVPEAVIKVLGPPPVAGLGNAGGFKFIIEDRSGDNDLNKLQEQADKLIREGSAPRLEITGQTVADLEGEPVPPALLAQLETIKGKTFTNKRQLLHELSTAFDRADVNDRAERDFYQGLVGWRAAAGGGKYCLTDDALEAVRDWRVPAEVPPQLAEMRGQVYETRGLFLKRLAVALTEAGLTDAAERDAVQNFVLSAAGRQDRATTGLFTVFRANTPQLYVDLNRDQCQAMGVNPNDVFQTLQVYLGSYYVNDFNKFGRTWQVVVQAEGPFRNDAAAVKRLKVRGGNGQMVPLGAVLNVREVGGPILVYRYNMYPAVAIVGGVRPGFSTGEGIDSMQRLADATLPQSMGYEWTEINFIQIDAAKNVWNQLIFPLAVVFVFLVLAAQYESWALPLAVILVVPMCILGSLTGVYLTHTDVNIFTQIGFVVLVGLASKNAILIVEFAKHKREAGLSRRDATLAACKLRLRPILMTSFAFILGVVPLLTARGAGAEMRWSLGTAVFSGMLGVTLFGIFLTPVFFYVIESMVEAPLFSSAGARRLGKVLLYVVGIGTLGIPWLLLVVLGRALRRPAPKVLTGPHAVTQDSGPVAANGTVGILAHDNGNGNGNRAAHDGGGAEGARPVMHK
jgi:hydrophobe/amphiphile efflux-1 (HAE1) family protein